MYGYDPDGDAITAQLVSGPSHGSLTFHANGSFTYTPNQRFVGSDSFTFTWTDGLVSDTVAHVWIEVYNHAPIAWGEEYVIAANAAWQLEAPGLLANDWDWDGDSLSVLLDQTAGIRLDPAPEPSASWSVELQPHGLVVVAPPPDWEGTMEIPYHVTDGVHTSGPAILRLRVNSGPLPRDDVYIVPEDEDLVIADPAQGVLANDHNPQQEGLLAELVGSPAGQIGSISLNSNGTFSFLKGPAWTSSSVVQFYYQLVGLVGAVGRVTLVGQEAAAPRIEFRRFDEKAGRDGTELDKWVRTETLRVATWEHAFRFKAPPPPEKKDAPASVELIPDFISREKDRFRIVVTHAAANQDSNRREGIRVRLRTGSRQIARDPGATLVLQETAPNSGVFVSRDLILVSVPADAIARIEGIYDGDQNDPTYLVQLGDSVLATYSFAGANYEAEAKVPVEHKVELRITITRWRTVPGFDRVPSVTEEEVNIHVGYAQMTFAPLGIALEVKPPIRITEVPADVDRWPTYYVGGYIDRGEKADPRYVDIFTRLNEQEVAFGNWLSGQRSQETDDIEIYYIPDIRTLGNEAQWNGCSYFDTYVANLEAPPRGPDCRQHFRGIIVITPVALRERSQYNTLAHELGHILMNGGGHLDGKVSNNRVNVMSDPHVGDPANPKIDDSRRWFTDQVKRIFSEGKNYLKKP